MIWPVFNRIAAPRYGLILLYHSVFEQVPRDLVRGIHNIRPHLLAEQLDWVTGHFEIVSLDEFLELDDVKGKAAITFDDAYESVFDHGLPILRARSLPATIFLNAKTVQGAPFWRDKIRYLINNDLVASFLAFRQDRWPDDVLLDEANFYRESKTRGINGLRLDEQIDAFAEFKDLEKDFARLNSYMASEADLIDDPLIAYGNHSLGHFVLSSLERNQQAAEIRNNHKALKQFGLPMSKNFAFPFGDLPDFDDVTLSILHEDGYSGALLSRNRLNARNRQTSYYAERWMPPDDMALFHRKLANMIIRQIRGHPN